VHHFVSFPAHNLYKIADKLETCVWPRDCFVFSEKMVSEQPHFDDERTVLSAQPVVPLERLEAKVKHRRRWFLGSAFAVAMLLGAASALVSAYFKLRAAPDPEIQTLSVLPISEPTPETVLPTPEEQPSVTPKRPVQSERKREFADAKPPVVEPPLRNEEDELRRIRDAVLVDEWQERRQRRAERRAERRERRRAERDSDRDLSNLDEIFEGRRRPKG
jgi:hypothetical protein